MASSSSQSSAMLRALASVVMIVVTSCFLIEEGNAVQILPTGIKVVVDGSKRIATVDDEFICATIDWWPASRCNFGSCPWYNTSLLNLDLENPILEQAVKELAPLKIRLGGTLQDQVEYKSGPCPPMVTSTSGLFGFSHGCLSRERWDVLNEFFKKTGASILFGLNALNGISSANGSWDPSNAEEFISYTHSQGYPVTAWELGNELIGQVSIDNISLTPQAYAASMKLLRAIVDRIYQNDATKPLLIGPSSFYLLYDSAYETFLAESGPNVVDIVTRHIYNLGSGLTDMSTTSIPRIMAGLDIMEFVQCHRLSAATTHRNQGILHMFKPERARLGISPSVVENILSHHANDRDEINYASLQNLVEQYPWTSTWIGEAGGSFKGGHGNVTNAFIFAFWYLDQLGLASKHNNKVFCRQSLVGGHYGLLDPISFVPNPDFYGALLWKKLMGNGVLSARVNSTDIRAYAHCQKTTTKGGVTVLLLNYSNVTSYSVDLSVIGQSNTSRATHLKQMPRESLDPLSRLEYHMSSEGGRGNILSRVVCLNGKPLRLTDLGDLPDLKGHAINGSEHIILEPLTYAFVVLQNCSAVACVGSSGITTFHI